MKPKVLLFDIEISPIVSYNWGLYESNAIAVVKDWQILCFAYKWLGEKKIHVIGQDDFASYKKGVNDDKNVVKKLHELFSEADIVIAHNAKKYDVKRVNTRFIFHKMAPPEPYRVIDTLSEVRKYASFSSNKLDYLSKQLGFGEKLDAGGIEIIEGCLAGNASAWKHLKRYNKVDVELLESLYLELRPWIDGHPSISIMSDMPTTCPKCGHDQLRQGGFFATKVGKRKRYQCLSCGGWCSGRLIEKTGVTYIN